MSEVDLSLHGVVRVRLVDPTPDNLAGVLGDTGLERASYDEEPHVTVRFVERLEVGVVELLGAEAGAAPEGYLHLPPPHWSGGRSLLPLTEVGGSCTLVCERSVRRVPLLIEVLNLTAGVLGLLPLHGAAFVTRDGVGWVAAGWSKGGKTETLLAVAGRGAHVVGDEWVYLRDDRALGSTHRMRLWDWQIAQLPEIEARLPAGQRRRRRVIDLVTRMHTAAPRQVRPTLPYRALSMLMPTVAAQSGVYVEPGEVFPAGALLPSCAVDRLLLVLSTTDGRVRTDPVDPLEVARRMAASLDYERRDLTEALVRYRFAMPDARNPWLESVQEREAALLRAAFAGRPAWSLRHPYPVALQELAGAVEALAVG